VARLRDLPKAEFLFLALDFTVSLGCGWVDFAMVLVLECEMP
jgi:hypothetical protein